VIDRHDLIFFKVYAAADSTGPRSPHYQDLLELQPTNDELAAAVAWTETQDPSPGFATTLANMLRQLRLDLPSDAR
jgi:hypothetical protein